MGGINEGQSLFSVASQMFLIVTIPVIIGVLLSGVLSSFEKIAKNISIILFVLVLIGLYWVKVKIDASVGIGGKKGKQLKRIIREAIDESELIDKIK